MRHLLRTLEGINRILDNNPRILKRYLNREVSIRQSVSLAGIEDLFYARTTICDLIQTVTRKTCQLGRVSWLSLQSCLEQIKSNLDASHYAVLVARDDSCDLSSYNLNVPEDLSIYKIKKKSCNTDLYATDEFYYALARIACELQHAILVLKQLDGRPYQPIQKDGEDKK